MLRDARVRAGLSLRELERRTGLHFSVLSQYERRERFPSEEALDKLSAALEAPELREEYLTLEDVRKIRTVDRLVIAVKRLMRKMGL